jgi:PLD-like domain
VLLAFLGAWLLTGWWYATRPLPPGLHVTSPEFDLPDDSIKLLSDLTSRDLRGDPQVVQQIHAALLDQIRGARDFLVIDYFLFNEQPGPSGELRYQNGIRPVARELREALLALRQSQPQLPILVLVDPINDYYRGTTPDALAPLVQAGIQVVVADVDALRDSDPAYSGLWRLLFAWWLKPGVHGGWGNPLDARGPSLPLAALLRVPNFKADHRKVLITGDGNGSLRGIVSSANPHDASSAHSNVALSLRGEALRTLLDSELAIAAFSGWQGEAELRTAIDAARHSDSGGAPAQAPEAPNHVSIATEGAISEALLATLDQTRAGDQVDIAQFYLSERRTIGALLQAAARGATVRVLLDPNKDAFGFEKSGMPNRMVASELIAASDGAIKLHWYRTHGEQFHVKLAAIRHGDELWLTVGSANLTRRNLHDYNLEANVIVRAPRGGALDLTIANWFDTLWQNRPGRIEYTTDADLYADPSIGRYWLYRFMEATGLSSF